MADEKPFKTYVVIEFSTKCKYDVIEWVENRFRDGAQLLTKITENSKGKKVFLHLGATRERFLRGAEELGLKKLYKTNKLREFTVNNFENFIVPENEDEFLTQSEKLKILDNEINNLTIDENQRFGDKLELHNYDLLINQMFRNKLVLQVFPIHDSSELEDLERAWYKSGRMLNFFEKIPLERIRGYFGESIAFYFGFFEFYTFFLFALALLNIVAWLLPVSGAIMLIICSVCNIVWSSLVVDFWKRRSASLSYKWGLFDMEFQNRPRPEFQGTPARCPITNKTILDYPKSKRTVKKFTVSYPIIGVSIIFSFLLMMVYYYFQDIFDVNFPDSGILHYAMRLIPSTIYLVVVLGLNIVYKYGATYLTDWENHRTQASYESNLTTKLYVFYFVNSFICLFYEAFVVKSQNNLANLVVSMFLSNAIVNKLTETFGPYLKKKYLKFKYQTALKKAKKTDEDSADDQQSVPGDNSSVVEKQSRTLDNFEGTYYDYVTIFEQFGYLIMFSSAFPWIAIASFLSNVIELRSDAFKYCHVLKRPFPSSNSNGIGTWLFSFEVIGFMAVLTNIGLIALNPEVREYFSDWSDLQYFFLFVLIEHIVIVFKIFIVVIIPGESSKTRILKQQYKYELIVSKLNANKSQSLNSQ